MSHQLKLCTWKELKEFYGIPYCRMHIRRSNSKAYSPRGTGRRLPRRLACA